MRDNYLTFFYNMCILSTLDFLWAVGGPTAGFDIGPDPNLLLGSSLGFLKDKTHLRPIFMSAFYLQKFCYWLFQRNDQIAKRKEVGVIKAKGFGRAFQKNNPFRFILP